MSPDIQSRQRNMPAPAPKVGQSAPKEKVVMDDSASEGEKSGETAKKHSVVIKTVGGKTFEQIGKVWIDTAYKGGKISTIKRSSNDFTKLESGLRNLANSFDEPVIIVWKGRNYRF